MSRSLYVTLRLIRKDLQVFKRPVNRNFFNSIFFSLIFRRSKQNQVCKPICHRLSEESERAESTTERQMPDPRWRYS